MKFRIGRTVLILGTVLLLVAPVEARLRALSDEELDGILAGQGKAASKLEAAGPPPEEPINIPLTLGGDRVTRTVHSLKEIRRQGVVVQALDYSCGAAALSTVSTYFFQKPVSESDVIATILVTGQTPQEGIRKYFRRKGFTLLDLKRASEARGYRTTGYRGMTLEDLVETIAEQRVPVLVPIRPFGYYHFVVVRGVKADRVFVADPAVGNMTMKVARFEDVWVDGIGFVLTLPKGGGPVASAAGSRNGSNGSSGSLPPILNLKNEEPVPDSSVLLPLMSRSVVPDTPQDTDKNFENQFGRRIMSIVTMQNYNAAVQFGFPAGNFIDFSPPPGRAITIQPPASQ